MTRLPPSLAALCALVFVVLATPRSVPKQPHTAAAADGPSVLSGAPQQASVTDGRTERDGLARLGGTPPLSAVATPEPMGWGVVPDSSGPVARPPAQLRGTEKRAPATVTQFERSAISAGWASWFPAHGDQAAVPWWRVGQDPVWAAVCAFPDGTAVCVDGGVWITGWCQCLVGTDRERLIDLSRHAFAQLADPIADGLVRVQVEIPTQGVVLPATDRGGPR